MSASYKLALVAASCLVLAACGGGGGGDSSVDLGPAVALTSTNYGTAAEEVVGVVADVTFANDLISSVLTGANIQRVISAPQFVQKHLPEVFSHLSQNRQQFTGAVYNEIIQCGISGSIALQANDADNNNQPDVGDTISITGNNCVEYGSTINGSLNMTVTSISGSMDYYPFSIGLNVSSNGFRVISDGATVASSGSFQMTMSKSNYSDMVIDVTSNLTTTTSSQGLNEVIRMSNYRVQMTTNSSQVSTTINGNINVPSLGSNTITVSTSTPFVTYNNGYPSTGRSLLRAANGGQVSVTATGTTNAFIELDANADGTYETSQYVSLF